MLLSEFPYIGDKFDFLFYQCILQQATPENRKNTDDLVCNPVANKYIYTALYMVPAFYRVSNLDNMIPIAGFLQTWPNDSTIQYTHRKVIQLNMASAFNLFFNTARSA